MNRYIIVDLDGTLCNCDHRRKYVEQKPKDWDSFYAGIKYDEINIWCEDIVDAMRSQGYDIVFCTGRAKKYEDVTRRWLDNKYLYDCDLFHVRGNDDYRPDFIVKKEVYKNEIEPNYGKPMFIIDDRASVVEMWRSLGLTCLQCAKGDF